MADQHSWTAAVSVARLAQWHCPKCGTPGLTPADAFRPAGSIRSMHADVVCRSCQATGRLELITAMPPAKDLTTASAGSSKRWEQPQLTLVPTEGQAASCATPPATEPAADVQPTAVTYGSFAGGCVGCDRAYGGQLINSENPDAPRRSWTELQQWYPQLKTVAGASPAASLRRMGVPFRRRGRTGPVLFSDLAAAICTIELGLPCVGLPGEYALRQRLLAPPDQADQAS